MATETTYPHIDRVGDQPARLRRMPRIRVAQLVMDYLAHGWSAEEMCRQHEYLTLAEAQAALLYYWDHRDEIDREISDELGQYDRDRADGSPSPLSIRLRARRAVERRSP